MPSTRTVSLLFVCGGNTCRSPMAAAMTSEELGERFHVESVGIDVGQKSASLEAIKVMQEHGLDINDHCPRDISSVNLNEYDFVIAMTFFYSESAEGQGYW